MLTVLKYAIQDISEFSREDLEKSFLCMRDARKAKVERFQNETSKQCTLAGEWLVRGLLAEVTGKPGESFTICADEKGKLHAENTPGLFFNISHSGSKVAAAVCDERVGVDIEVLRPVSLKLAKRVCTVEELLYVFGRTPAETDFEDETNPECIRRFFEVWTAKEAYFKCIGTGITGFDAMQSLPADFKKIKIENEVYIMHIVTLNEV